MNVEDELLYEYYWEYAFPHTPTTFALRSGRYKFIYYHGIWDLNEFYDLQTDPQEQRNLVNVPSYAAEIKKLSERLFDRLEATGGDADPSTARDISGRGEAAPLAHIRGQGFSPARCRDIFGFLLQP
jgi:hypothetical protein